MRASAGKSQLMKFAARLSPRSVITSGKASSAAGLTATAVKEDSHWALEAGVLPNLALICITIIEVISIDA